MGGRAAGGLVLVACLLAAGCATSGGGGAGDSPAATLAATLAGGTGAPGAGGSSAGAGTGPLTTAGPRAARSGTSPPASAARSTRTRLAPPTSGAGPSTRGTAPPAARDGSGAGSPSPGSLVRPPSPASGLFFGGGPSLYPRLDTGAGEGPAKPLPALLRPVTAAVSRTAARCDDLAVPGGTHRCGSVSTGSAVLAWLDETMTGADGLDQHQVSVWRADPATRGGWVEQLATQVPDAIGVAEVDVTQVRLRDGSQQLAVQYAMEGSGAVLVVDLVGGAGTVAASFGVYRGTFTVEPDGALTALYPMYAQDDPNCCPSLGRGRAAIRWTGGTWRFASVTHLPGSG